LVVLKYGNNSGREYKTCKVFDEELRHAKQNLGFDPSKFVNV
jgi:hypothetical protein